MLWSRRCFKISVGRWRILEDWKIKISVLWLIYDVAGLVAVVLMFMEPGVVTALAEEGTIAGTKLGPEMLLAGAVTLLIPLAMAFLSLTLKDKMTRWTNIIVGIVYIGLGIGDFAEVSTAEFPAYAILMIVSQFVVAALIVWHAWKSKQKA